MDFVHIEKRTLFWKYTKIYIEITQIICMNKLKFIFFLKTNMIELKMANTIRVKLKIDK
jgi:hypothetical protein